MASNHPVKAANDDDDILQLYEGSLKFVRWAHQVTSDKEISVKLGNEVKLHKKVGEDSWKCEMIEPRTGEIGIIPVKCFIPRVTVNWPYSAKNNLEVSVYKDEIVGVINKDAMWKIVKKNGENGEVPSYCFNLRKKVEWPYSGEITLKDGDVVGVERGADKNGSKLSEIEIRTEDGTMGLVPRYCFYEKFEVVWNYSAEDGGISVQKGEQIGVIEKDVIEGSKTMWQIWKKDGTKGLIPSYCFYKSCQVLEDYKSTDIEIRKGQEVGLPDKDFAFFKVVVDGKSGFVPAKIIDSGTLSTDSEKKKTLVATEESPHKDKEQMVGLGLGVEESKIHSTCDETDNLHHD